ncbi:MAG: hypothetical protein MJ056_07190 [Akkermansia sp.]|nr:hypothetical protein [Akkermansia sp.]
MKRICMFLVLCLPVLAQDAAQTSERLRESMERRALQEQVEAHRQGPALPEGFKTEEDKADEEAPSAEERKPVLPLKHLEFGPTRVVPETLLAGLRAKYEGRTVSIADIKAIAAAVNKYYREHGYLTSRAYLPEQDVSKGTLRVELMEGTVGKVDATGLTTTKPEYVRRASGIKPGEVFRTDTLEAQLAEFNSFTDLKSRLNISPGKADGTSDLELVMQERKRFGATLLTDNAGQQSTGYYRGGVFASARGLASTAYTRDILTAGYVGSRGANTFSGAYSITENVLKTTWGVSLDHSKTHSVTNELRELGVESKYSACTLNVKRSLYSNARNILSNGLAFTFKSTSSTISGYKMYDSRTNTLAYNLDYLALFNHGYLYNAVSATRGWQLGGEYQDFWRANYRLEGNYAFNNLLAANCRFNAQTSNRRVMQGSEQVQIGGVNSIRGYEEGMLNGERGYALQVELRANIKSLWASAPSWLDSAEFFAFYDCGQLQHESMSQALTNASEAFLASTGCGIRCGLLHHLNGSFTMAMPLKKHYYNLRDNKPHWLFAVTAEF